MSIKSDGNPPTKRPSLFKPRFRSSKKPEAGIDEIRGPLGLRCLFSPPEPLIDVVFVHGLRGGSIKTFCKDDDPELFWPKQWLPLEPEFANATIHSFGYDSDWGSSRPSVLTVHDFGRSLYEELQTSPLLRHNSKNRPIVLVGHSMGGLVIKKAYILAQQDEAQHNLANRIRSVFFLATPHRGSDYAKFLDGALGSLGFTNLTSSKAYVNDLRLDSVSTQQINEDFARLAIAAELTIYTFYELWSTIPGASTLIVKKNSAVLGSNKNEHIQYLEANHRDICKYGSKNDSNYIRVKNALGTAVEKSLKNDSVANDKNRISELQKIKKSLGSPDLPLIHHDILEGSCEWIEDREDFQEWGNLDTTSGKEKTYKAEILWIQAQPGAGKTVLAAHVASRLAEDGHQTSSYFFQYGKETSQSLSDMLLSLAYQMALNNTNIREKLVQLCDEGIQVQQHAYTAWTRIFVGGLFQVSTTSPQFWVIDGLDECATPNDFARMLNGIQTPFPLRIFITSRKLPTMQKIIDHLKQCQTTVIQIPVDDTMRDINSYISKRMQDLPVDGDEERGELASEIRAKCSASFLWVRLVMDELEGVYGYDGIREVLKEIPEGMLPYYERAVTEMARKREVLIAKAILTWIVLAARPLSVSELSSAIEQDLKNKISSQRGAIEGLCGHLVAIDSSSNLIHIVHATARDFLMSEAAGNLKVSAAEGHHTLAINCIKVMLKSGSMAPHKNRLLGNTTPSRVSSPLLNYASVFFSEHVFASSAFNNQVCHELCSFLKRDVLKWIESVVGNYGLHVLVKTATNLNGYADRWEKYDSSCKSLLRTVAAWALDLSRISSRFGKALITSPQSIYFLIPPLCPTQSAIYTQFVDLKQANRLTLKGPPYKQWDDCIAHIYLEDESSSSVATGHGFIAVGTYSGKIFLFDSQTYQERRVLHLGSSVDLVKFDPLGAFWVASGNQKLTVWELDGSVRFEIHIRSQCILLSSAPGVLIGVTPQGRSFRWDIITGELLGNQIYAYQPLEIDKGFDIYTAKVPFAAALSRELGLLALAYRNSFICIFEFSSGEFVSRIMDAAIRAPDHILFNPNPDMGLLAVAYDEGHLAVYEPWSGSLITSLEADKRATILSMTCASDGRKLATFDVLGRLRVWNFETLTLLYHVLTPQTYNSLLDFAPDATSLIQLISYEVRIWAPSALSRKTSNNDYATIEGASSVVAATDGQYDQLPSQDSMIRTIVAHPSASLFFASKENGDVLAYSSTQAYEPVLLYSHSDVSVHQLAVSSNNLIASMDVYSHLQVRQLDTSSLHQGVKVSKPKIEINFEDSVRQLLFDETGAYILVSTWDSVYVHRTTDGSLVGTTHLDPIYPMKMAMWTVASSSLFVGQFLLAIDDKIVCYSAEKFPTMISSEKFLLDCRAEEATYTTEIIDSFVFDPTTSTFILELSLHAPYGRATSTFIFEIQASKSHPISPIPYLRKIMKRFIGVNNDRIVFLNHESWICSVDSLVVRSRLRRYTRHFFVPNQYILGDSLVPIVQTANGDFAFCINDKVVVVQNGLNFQAVKEIV